MSKVVDGLYYSREHDWVRVEGGAAYIGITDYAQSSLGDIVFADGEPVGTELLPGQTLGVVESVKAASDIVSPLSGTLSEVNADVVNDPSLLNSAPFGAWLVRIDLSSPDELGALMDAGAYSEFLKTL